MGIEENKAVVRRVVEQVWTRGDLAAVDQLYAEDYVSHQHGHVRGPRDVCGREDVKRFVQEFRSAFPDFRDSIEEQLADGDKVITRFVSMGTQRGPFGDLPPTNKPVRWEGIEIDRIVEGRIAESWVSWDMMGLMQQLGAEPTVARGP